MEGERDGEEECEVGLHTKRGWRCRQPDRGAASVQRSLDFILQQIGHQQRGKEKRCVPIYALRKISLASIERTIVEGKNRGKE